MAWLIHSHSVRATNTTIASENVGRSRPEADLDVEAAARKCSRVQVCTVGTCDCRDNGQTQTVTAVVIRSRPETLKRLEQGIDLVVRHDRSTVGYA
jgi:hypothetical protein